MVDPVRSAAYLGLGTGRWGPATWDDIVDAAAGGLIDESYWVDLKQELPLRKASVNTDVAKDLASLAVDGGLLIIGVETTTVMLATSAGSSWPGWRIV